MRKSKPFVVMAACIFIFLTNFTVASASSTARIGTTFQVRSAVRLSISATKLSPGIISTLKEFSSPSSFKLTGPSTFGNCDPYNSEVLALNPKPCFAGNLHGSKTIVLVGDSNAGNWVPALNLGLKSTPYRLAIFGFSSCGLSNLPYSSAWSALWKRCREWHVNVPKAIRSLHPFAVIAASGDVGISFSNTTWANGVRSLFDAATRGLASTKRIIMGTTPYFSDSVVTCLSVHPDPQDCMLKYTPGTGYYGSAYARDELVAKTSGAKLVNTSPYFCYADSCSPVIGNILVYSDTDHVTIQYSSFISKCITQAVLSALN